MGSTISTFTVMYSGGAKGESLDVIKSGDAWAGLTGFPSIYKNALLSTLTDKF